MVKKIVKKNILLLVVVIMFGTLGMAAADNLNLSELLLFDKNKLKNETGIETTAETVKQALNELYEKARHIGECPSGYNCNKISSNAYLPENDTNSYVKSEFVQSLKVGDYIQMIPSETSFLTNGGKTGYQSQIVNPKELTLWRIIRKNTNGTVDVVSEYVTSINVYFCGVIGYQNYIGYLNELASHYENPNYTIGSRYMGYDGTSTEYISDSSKISGSTGYYPWSSSTSSSTTSANEALGAGDMGYETDYNLVKVAYGNASDSANAYKVGTTTYTEYFLASRSYYYGGQNNSCFEYRYITTSGYKSDRCLRYFGNINDSGSYHDTCDDKALRPILTLKADITTNVGDGSKDNPYVLG